MTQITVNASQSYNIFIEHDILAKCGEILSSILNTKTLAIITDDIVNSLYADTVVTSLTNHGFKVCKFVFPNGENSKNISVLNEIYDFLCKNNITRTDCLIALGGGVVSDITGFAAATFLRGLDYVQIPTTLLSQIDSSVGGKTAVNLSCGKNLVGAFKQPECVICDPKTLITLSKELLSDGMAEAIKYGMIRNEKLFELFEGHTIDNIMDCIDKVVYRCISIKKDVVEADEFDKGERMILNFGHTLGHAIEKFYDYKISHGNAVAIGMCLITECAYKAGICDVEMLNRLISCIKAYNLPYKLDANINALVDLCSNDKKRQSDKISFIVCSKIGHSIIKKTSVDDFRSFILK